MQNILIDISAKIYQWPISTWKHTRLMKSSGKCKLKPYWNTISHTRGKLELSQIMTSVGNQLELSYAADGNVKWHS